MNFCILCGILTLLFLSLGLAYGSESAFFCVENRSEIVVGAKWQNGRANYFISRLNYVPIKSMVTVLYGEHGPKSSRETLVMEKKRSHALLICGLFFGALGLSLALAFFTDIPERDVSGRYAPMADAFAAGEWAYAFHTRIPMLFPVVSGVIAWCCQCGGFWAAKLASSLFFALGVFPLYGIFRRVFGDGIALWGSLLYLFCSHVLRLASSGLRDEAKGFTFFLALYGLLLVWQERRKLAGYFWCGFGGGLLALARGDCSLYALTFIVFALIFELLSRPKFYIPWRAVTGGLLMTVVLLPATIYNYQTIGYPVPEVRIGVLLQKFEKVTGFTCFAVKKHSPVLHAMVSETAIKSPPASSVAPPPAASPKFSVVIDDKEDSHSGVNDLREFMDGVFKGLYPYFFCIAMVVIAWRFKSGQWSPAETILLAALFGHCVLLVAQIAISDHYLYISRRYMLPVAPLSFGWTAIGLLWGYEKLRSAFPRYVTGKTVAVVMVMTATGLFLDAAGPLIKAYTSAKKSRVRKATIAVAKWIKADYQGPNRIRVRQYNPVLYYSDRRPAVLSDALPVVGYVAGGENISTADPELLTQSFWPDYLVLSDEKVAEVVSDGYRPVSRMKICSVVYTIWKRQPTGVK